MPLANLASIEQREDLLWHFTPLSLAELARLCDAVNLRSELLVEDIKSQVDAKQLLLEVLVAKFEKRASQIEKINALPLYPDEVHILHICDAYNRAIDTID